MASICLYFQVHQPRRLKKFQVFDIGHDVDYFADYEDGTEFTNPKILREAAESSYFPANNMLMDLFSKHPEFKITMSFTGVFIEQMEEHMPELLKSFQDLVSTGRVEVLGETYYHSLASVYSKAEFIDQIQQHTEKIQEVFDVTPKVFRNTELVYKNEVASIVAGLGFEAVIAEGVKQVLDWRSPNYLYAAPSGLPLMVKNENLSDDITKRFSENTWQHFPLTADKYSGWVEEQQAAQVVNIFMDYETLGMGQSKESGIFDFFKSLPKTLLKSNTSAFAFPSEVITNYEVSGVLDFPHNTSWANKSKNLDAWHQNEMQISSIKKAFGLRNRVLATQDAELISTWRHLLQSEHFLQMASDWEHDGPSGKYFSHFESPYVAFLSYMNTFQDLEYKVRMIESENQTEEIAVAPQVLVSASA